MQIVIEKPLKDFSNKELKFSFKKIKLDEQVQGLESNDSGIRQFFNLYYRYRFHKNFDELDKIEKSTEIEKPDSKLTDKLFNLDLKKLIKFFMVGIAIVFIFVIGWAYFTSFYDFANDIVGLLFLISVIIYPLFHFFSNKISPSYKKVLYYISVFILFYNILLLGYFTIDITSNLLNILFTSGLDNVALKNYLSDQFTNVFITNIGELDVNLFIFYSMFLILTNFLIVIILGIIPESNFIIKYNKEKLNFLKADYKIWKRFMSICQNEKELDKYFVLNGKEGFIQLIKLNPNWEYPDSCLKIFTVQLTRFALFFYWLDLILILQSYRLLINIGTEKPINLFILYMVLFGVPIIYEIITRQLTKLRKRSGIEKELTDEEYDYHIIYVGHFKGRNLFTKRLALPEKVLTIFTLSLSFLLPEVANYLEFLF